MFCPQCGNNNPDAAKFCMRCGYSYESAASPSSDYSPSVANQHHPAPPTVIIKRGGGGLLFLLLLLLLGGGLVVFLLLNSGVLVRQKDWLGREKPIVDVKASDKEVSGKLNLPEVRRQRTPAQEAAPAPAYDSQPQRQQGGGSLVADSFSVPAGSAKWWSFTVPASSTGRVVGDFRARGGSGNDIEAGITDENGANGHAGRFWYHSGKVTTGSIDVQLGPGTYYLVFNNRFSLFTQKVVYANVNLELR
jgi:hypothetical protein